MHARNCLRIGTALLGGVMTTSVVNAATATLPAEYAVPADSVGERGFTVRTVRGPATPALANNFVRAVRQLNGTLTDAEGNLVPNEAVPDSRPGGAYFTDTVNFERD